MSDHEALRQESPDTQRKRIEAMAQDPEMQQVAATARPRGPERSPQPDTSDKQMMQHRLATMAEVAERDPKIEQRIKEREQARDNRAAAKHPVVVAHARTLRQMDNRYFQSQHSGTIGNT